jgi:hypothetical protein
MKGVLEETPEGHVDQEAIPQLLDVIKALGKETEPGVASAKQKVELWRYNANLVFKPGEYVVSDRAFLFARGRSSTGRVCLRVRTSTSWTKIGL